MKLKTYIPLIVITVCLVVVLCMTNSWFATPAVQYSTVIGRTYVQTNSGAIATTTFKSVTPDYLPARAGARTKNHNVHTTPAMSGNVFSSTIFHQPQFTTFGETSHGIATGDGNTFHTAIHSNPSAALAVNMPMPQRNTHIPARSIQANTTKQENEAATYAARALPKRSAGGQSLSTAASVAPLAITTYDENYSINGNANQLNGRRNAIDLGDGHLPENPMEPGTPVGDVPWIFILCLSLAYALLRYRKRIATLFILCILASTSFAVPAYRGWQTKTQPDGTTIEVRLTGDEFHHYWQDQAGNVVKCDSLGYWRVVESQPTPATIKARRQASAMLQSRQKKAVGAPNLAPRGLVILVNFSNSKFANANNQAAMKELMNSDNYTDNGATGSVRQFFSDQSDGQYKPDFDVIGPVTLTNNVAHYGGNDASGNDVLPGDMVVEACSIANAQHAVDFTQYDNDSDGEVDFVYLIYAGKGEADGGAENTIWPHNWDLASAYYYNNCSYSTSQRKFDGKYINNYACSGELNGQSGARTGIGTIAHEFGHVIGLPDLYDIDYGQNYEDNMTPGAWHIMDGGSYNNDGKTPPNYTIYDKYFLGWKEPTNPGNTPQTLTLQAAGTDGYNAYQITSDRNSLLAATNATTAYYIENRQQSGWDKYLPGHGLVIWRIMYSQSVWEANGPNATPGTLRYAVVSASGATTKIGTASDPFPGTKKVTRWEGVSSKPLLNITESGGVITLTYIDDAACHSVLTNGTSCTITPSSDCVANGAVLTANITPADASYDITSVSVQLGSTTLTKDTHYTLSNNNQYLTINGSAITGDASNAITISATATKARWTYEVLYENATVSSETGAVAKGGTITLTVTPALGYVLTEENIEVEIGGVAKDFTYSGTTLTIPNVTGNVAIYIMPEIDPENAITFTRLTNTAMLQAGAKCILVYAETPAVAGQLMSNTTYLASVTEGFTVNGTEITTQKTNTDISIFTLGESTGAWTLTNSEGKKLSGTDKTLVWNGTNSTWTIAVGTDGKTQIGLKADGTLLQYNASDPRFRTYTSAQKGLYLYISQSGEIVKQDPVITFTKTGDQTIKLNQTLSNPATSTYGTVTYSSSDETTATVNSSGLVTPKKAGTVTITASVAEGTYNNAASASYQLTITALATYTVTWMANGSQFAKVTYTEGDKLALPATTPTACANTKKFVGWTTTNNYAHDTQAPTYVSAGEEVTANATYYAVYALEKAGSANVVTTTMTNFTATSANMDSYISYAAAQGTALNEPVINNGEIRIYQNGGTLTVTAKTGAKINAITIGSSMATKVTYKTDNGSTSTAQTISANGKFTKSGLNANSVLFTCVGTDKTSRLYLNDLEVTYTAGTATTYMYYSTDCSGEIDLTTAPTLKFTDANKVLTIEDTYTNELDCNSTGAKTFTSSDVNVATVDATGQVTAKAAGNTTITVAVAAVAEQFSAATASYNITVVRKKATPSFDVAQVDLKTGESRTVMVNKGEHNGEVTYTSADTKIATVDPITGQVLGVSAGFTTITATIAQTAIYETASATYTVYVSAKIVSDGTLGVTWIADGVVLTDSEATHRYTSGDALIMPSTEVGATNGKVFVGWTAIKDYQNPFCPPADLFDTAEGKKVTANITYYAVYKTK